MQNSKTVSLIYGYSARNAGDFAITLGAIDTLLGLGVRVKLFSRYCAKNKDFHQAQKSLRERYGDAIEIYECPFCLDRTDGLFNTLWNYVDGMLIAFGLRRKSQFRRNLLDCDLVIFNGGNLFRCNSFIDFARLAALVYPLNIARKKKKPYIIFPQSASTLNALGQMLLKPILRDAKTVMIREEESYDYLNRIVPDAEFFKTIDLAFFINKEQLPKTEKDYGGYVALTMRFHTVGDIAYLSNDSIDHVFNVLGGVVEEIKAKRKVVIVVQTEKDFDLSVNFAHKHSVELVKCQDVPTLISLYKQVDLLIGMRLHSMILALSTGTPCLGVFYKEWGLKNPGLMSMFNMPYYFLDEKVSSAALLQSATKLLRDKEEQKESILSMVITKTKGLTQRLISLNGGGKWLRQLINRIKRLCKRSQKILIIGAVPHPDDLKSYGGCTTLMQNFIDFCRDKDYRICHVETLRYKNRLLNMVYFALKFLWGLMTCRVVMYNVSYNGAFTLFPMTASLAYALKRKVVMRRFGGYFIKQIEEMPPRKRLQMVRLLNKADLIYFETQTMLAEAPKLFAHPKRIHWFPNCRKPATVARQETGYRKRFAFISHLRVDKGVDLLLNVADTLPADYTVHIYGSIYDQKYADPHYFYGHRAEYRGALRTEDVLPTLAQYDVLVLPSYCATEGYPGIIIEAMSLGVPAIATRHGGIPELIIDGKNGLLIPIRSEEALREAMLSVNADNYVEMSKEARKRFDERYNSGVVNARIYKEMLLL